MPNIDYTVDGSVNAMVNSVYRRVLSPNSQNTLLPADIIDFMDEEMRTTILPLILAAQEEFFVQNFDQPVLQNVYAYTIPPRASFATWRDVVFVDQNYNELNMSMLSPEYLKVTYPAGGNPPLYVFGFILKNDQIILYPNTAGTPTQYILRMKIKRRPNNLVSTSVCGQITTINTGTNVVTLSNVDPTWTSSTLFDIIPNSPQFTSRQDNQPISLISGNNLTFIPPPGLNYSHFPYQPYPALPVGLSIGDWVCQAQTSCVPQVPYDMFPLLVQRGVIKTLEALGDTQNLTIAERRYQDMAADFARTVSPRIDGTPKKIVNRNTPPYWGSYGFPFSR